jgi:hypothetical protein
MFVHPRTDADRSAFLCMSNSLKSINGKPHCRPITEQPHPPHSASLRVNITHLTALLCSSANLSTVPCTPSLPERPQSRENGSLSFPGNANGMPAPRRLENNQLECLCDSKRCGLLARDAGGILRLHVHGRLDAWLAARAGETYSARGMVRHGRILVARLHPSERFAQINTTFLCSAVAFYLTFALVDVKSCLEGWLAVYDYNEQSPVTAFPSEFCSYLHVLLAFSDPRIFISQA